MALSSKRKGRITGSRVGAILGLNPWATPESVMRDMVREYHGAPSEFTGNAATAYGSFHEQFALQDLQEILGKEIKECGDNEVFSIHPQHDWLGATPDGRVGPFGVEIKCPYSKRDDIEPSFKSAKEQMHYYAQMQYEMACAGTEMVYFFQWSKNCHIVEQVHLDQKFIDETMGILEDFYNRYLIEIENPAHLEPLVIEIPHHLAADEYKIARGDMEAAKEKMEAAKAQLVELAGGKKAKIAGLTVYEVEKKGSVSYAKVVKEHCPGVDLEPYRGKSSKYWVVK